MVEQVTKKNTRFEIFTPDGFKSFDGIVKQEKPGIKFITNIGSITVSKDHAFIINESIVLSTEIKIGDYFNKLQFVVDIECIDLINLYDPINVGDNHVYFGNNIEHHNCHFLGSSHTLISAETIARLSSSPFIHSKDNFDALEAPEKDHSYFIVVDTSRGVERDYSAFVVMDVTDYPFKLVAKYKNNQISPLLYPDVVIKAARDYNYAHVLVEINDIGQQVADIIHNDLEYENMIWVGSDSKYGQYMSTSGRNARLGLRTTSQVKRIGCSTFKSLVEENKLLIFDGDVISEISTFIESKGSFAADEGYHDDLIMPLVLFSWASNEPLFKDLTNANNRKALYAQKMVQIEEEMTPFGFMNNINNEEPEFTVQDGDLWLSEKWQGDYKRFLEEKLL